MFDALLATLGTLGVLASIAFGVRTSTGATTDAAPAPEEASPPTVHPARSRRRGRARASHAQCASRTGKGLRSSR